MTRPIMRAAVCTVAAVLSVCVTACASEQATEQATELTAPESTSAATPASQAERPAGPIVISSDDVPLPTPSAAVLPASAPSRIVSLATGVAETMVALGLGDRIVGRDETSTAPQLADVPVMTKAHAVSAERVLSTSPDLVIADASTSPPEALDQIRAAGVEVVQIPEAWSPADIGPRVRALAAAVGLDAAAAEATTQAWLPTPSADPPGAPGTAPRVAFLYLRGTSAIYLLGGEGSGADALIAAAGGVDVGAESGLPPFTPLTAEALAAADPDVLLVMTGGLESVDGTAGLARLPGVAQTRAGEQGRIVAVEDTLLLSYGPRTGALVQALADALADARSDALADADAPRTTTG